MKISHRLTAGLLALCLVFSLFTLGDMPTVLRASAVWDGVASASFSSGDGTQSNPYIIKTEAQMGYFRQLLSEGMTFTGMYLKLMADLDMTGGNWTWSGSTSFNGDFNGNGHILTVDTQFVNTIGAEGRVHMLIVKCPEQSDLPLLCFNNNGTIEGCVASGKVWDTEYYSGGMVYQNAGTMINVGFKGTVGGENMDVGGLVYRNTGVIQNAYTSVVLDAYSSGKYGASSEDPVAGVNSGTITDVYYDGATHTSPYGTAVTAAEMTAQAFVSTLNQNNPSLTTKWAADSASVNGGFPIPAADEKSDIVCSLSGVEGDAVICNSGTSFTITKSIAKSCDIYYTTDGSSPITSSTRIRYTGSFKVTKDMTVKMVARENSVYGRVQTQKIVVMAGAGTEASPYQITTKAQLLALAVEPDAWFELKNDLTFTDSDFATGGICASGWQPIKRFSGVLEGNGYAISNLQGIGGGFVKSNTGTISGIRFLNHQLTSSSACFGPIAESNGGTITKCYVNLNVTTIPHSSIDLYVGGMVGSNSGVISHCQIDGNLKVVGPNYRYCWVYASGIAAMYGTGRVESCYSKLDMEIVSKSTTEYVYYSGIAHTGYIYNCRNDGTVDFDIALDYDIYANAFSNGSANNCYGSLSYTNSGYSSQRIGSDYSAREYQCYSTKGGGAQLLESSFPNLDFTEKWMITADGPVPQGIMNADGTCYTKTGYRRPACADGYTTYVDQSGKTYSVALPKNGTHLGGTATCTASAVCELCSVSYGALDPSNHTGTAAAVERNDANYPFKYENGMYTSTNKANSTTSAYTIEAAGEMTVGIAFTVSSETNYDKLQIVKNDYTILYNYSGEFSGAVNVPLVAGEKLQIKYVKDGSQSRGSDQISFVLSLPPAQATCTTDLVCKDCGVVVEPAFGHNYVEQTNDTTYPFTYADGVYTSTNKTRSTTSTYTYTALEAVKITVDYSAYGYSNYHYMRIKQNTSTLHTFYGTTSGTVQIRLNKGDKLHLQYVKGSSGTVTSKDCATFKVTAIELASQCPEEAVCSTCNKVVKDATTHTYVNHAAQAATCTQYGWDAYRTCENCDYTTYVKIPATGHSYVTHEAKAATCTEVGWNSYRTCEKCDYTTYSEIPATGHRYATQQNDSIYPFSYSGGKYTSTNKADSSSSTFTVVASAPLTLQITYTVSSEANFDKLIISKNSSTLYTYSGEKSGDVYVELEPGDTLKLKYSKDSSQSRGSDNATFVLNFSEPYATCSKAVTCATCGVEVVGKTEHSYIDHEAKAPTCTAIGWNAYQTCANCSYTTYAQLAAAHSYVDHEAKAPTCTEIGWAAYQTCANCDYTTYAEQAATGHSYVDHAAKTPTCTEIGWAAYQTCANCDYTTYAEQAATGHSYADGACTACGEAKPPVASGTCGENLTWTLDDAATLTISGTGDMTDYESGTIPWYDNRESIKTVVIESGLTSIGDCAFYQCRALTSVTIPDSVTSIGRYAFSWCTSLTSFVIPESVTSIGESAFYYCTGLTEITIPNSVTSIAGSAFSWCTSLTGITLPDGVTSINDSTFNYCTGLTDITIPDSVTNIGSAAFANCSALTAITIPNSVNAIGEGVFGNCENLSSLQVADGNTVYHSAGNCIIATDTNTVVVGCKTSQIPDGVTSIEQKAFSDCIGLTSINIPSSVTTIRYAAFIRCNNLTDVYYGGTAAQWEAISIYGDNECLTNATIHYVECEHIYVDHEAKAPTCTEVGWNAYQTCEKCDYTTYEELAAAHGYVDHAAKAPTCTEIGWAAYQTCANCDYSTYAEQAATGHSYADGVCTACGAKGGTCGENLTWTLDDAGTLTISGTGDMTNYDCNAVPWYSASENVKTIVIEDGVTSIGEEAFLYCNTLKSIIIPNSVTSIGFAAFGECSKLADVYYGGTQAQWAEISIDWDNDFLTSAMIHYTEPAGPAVVANGTCGENVTWTLDDTGLLTISGTGAMSVDATAPWYEYRESVKTVVIQSGVTAIGAYAFNDCGQMTEITIADSVKEIGAYAFSNCFALTAITIPEGVTNIAERTFVNCTALHSVTIPGSVTNIDSAAFISCSALTDITLPSGLVTIGMEAFYASALTEITIPVSVTVIGEWAFSLCNGLTDVYYGGTAEQWAAVQIFGGNEKLTEATIHYTECDHVYVDHEAKAPTCTEIGCAAYQTCENCDYSTYAEQAATGHTYVDHEAKAPTCTEIGWNAYQTCEKCDYTTYDELAAAHSYVDHEAKAPTCTEIGWAAYQTCENCDYTTYAEQAATGHSYADGTCTGCGTADPSAIVLTGIAIKTQPNKTSYLLDESLDTTGLTLTATYSDGSTRDITEGFSVSGYDSGTVGTMTLTAAYEGFTASFTVTVNAPVTGENTPQILVGTASSVVGNLVYVDISLKNNPGIVTMQLEVEFDDTVLTLKEVQDKGKLGAFTHRPELVNPYTLRWANNTATQNFTATGEIVTLVFEVAEDAPLGMYPILLSYSYNDYHIMDWQMNKVLFAVQPGGVEVVDAIIGDVNGDGNVDNRDSMILDRYLTHWDGYDETTVNVVAADVNCDGKVNNMDSMILARHLAKWSGYEDLPYATN